MSDWFEATFGDEEPLYYDPRTGEIFQDEAELDWQHVYGRNTEYGEEIYFTGEQWHEMALYHQEELIDYYGVDPYDIALMLEDEGLWTWEDWREFYGEN